MECVGDFGLLIDLPDSARSTNWYKEAMHGPVVLLAAYSCPLSDTRLLARHSQIFAGPGVWDFADWLLRVPGIRE